MLDGDLQDRAIAAKLLTSRVLHVNSVHLAQRVMGHLLQGLRWRHADDGRREVQLLLQVCDGGGH